MASTLYEYYTGKGQGLPSVAERAPVYEQYGLGKSSEYAGTAEQNTRLLSALQGGSQSQSQQQPTSKEEVTPYLNQFQQNLLNQTQAPEVKVPTMEELKTQLTPTAPLPEPLNRVAELEKLRTTYGVSDLEKSLTDIKDQIEGEYNLVRQQRGIEEGKPVPLGVIEGRISEEEKQAQVRIDALGRQQARIVDELNTKYGVINQIMTLEGLDYNDATKRYDDEFQRNLAMYDIIAGARKEARSAFEYDQQAARANLQIYANAAISGNIDYNSLSGDQKLMIQKLEIQSGLPPGLISSIKKDPKADIVFTTSNNGIVQVGFRNADGTIRVEQYGKKSSGGGGGGWKIEGTGTPESADGISNLWSNAA